MKTMKEWNKKKKKMKKVDDKSRGVIKVKCLAKRLRLIIGRIT